MDRAFNSELRKPRFRPSGGVAAVVVVAVLAGGVALAYRFLPRPAATAIASNSSAEPEKVVITVPTRPERKAPDKFGPVAIDIDNPRVKKELDACSREVVAILKDYARQMEGGRFEEVELPKDVAAREGVACPEDLLRLHISVYEKDNVAAWLTRRADHFGYQEYSQNYTAKRHPLELKIQFGSHSKAEAEMIIAASKMYKEAGYKFDSMDPARRELLWKWALFFDLE